MMKLRNFFVAGLIVLTPLMTTLFFLRILFNFVDGFLQPLITRLTGIYIPGLGVISTITIIIITGLLATNYFGSQLIQAAERILRSMPIVRGIYVTAKQIVDAFFHPETTPFKKVCLVEYPRRGIYTVGFVTGEIPAPPGSCDEDLVSIFVAATPNPTFGFYIIVPRRDVVYLDMGVDEGLKLVVSGGIIMPHDESQLFRRNKSNGAEQE